MSNYEIRAVTKLNLDSVREKDIIEEINSLIEHRKFGNYITNLLRFAAEHRADLEELGFNGASRGLVDTRKKMIEELRGELLDLKTKVDCIFEMMLELKTAFEVGHVTAIDTQVDNLIAAKIVVQNQMNKLKRTIGDGLGFTFEGFGTVEKSVIDKTAKEAAELALAHYGSEISQLASSFNELRSEYIRPVQADVDYVGRNINIAGAVNSAPVAKSETEEPKVEATEVKKAEAVANVTVKDTTDLQFDSDEADLDALGAFFGMD